MGFKDGDGERCPNPHSPVLQLFLGGFSGQAEEVLVDGVNDVYDVCKIAASSHLHQDILRR